MKELNSWDPIEIQQGLLLMIHEYGLADLLDAFSELIRSGSLGSTEDQKLMSIACYLAFASSEAAEVESTTNHQNQMNQSQAQKVA